MSFPDQLGVITCKCVLDQGKPVLFASHAGGEWQMYCHWKNHDFDDEQTLKNNLKLVHVAHLVMADPSLEEIADLPVDMGAEREYVGAMWKRYEDQDDD